jgi:hypothetical protein
MSVKIRIPPARAIRASEGVKHVRYLIALLHLLPSRLLRRSILAAGLSIFLAYSGAAQDIAVSKQTFGCILDWPKVRNTYLKNSDPEKLKDAIRIFRDNVPDIEYPVGTILQLVPFEAMVKHPREEFPKTNGREFFALDDSEDGSKIRDRGDNVVNLTQGITYLSCHQPAARFDFVCEKGHGCAAIPLDDQKILELQNADPRCTKKSGMFLSGSQRKTMVSRADRLNPPPVLAKRY